MWRAHLVACGFVIAWLCGFVQGSYPSDLDAPAATTAAEIPPAFDEYLRAGMPLEQVQLIAFGMDADEARDTSERCSVSCSFNLNSEWPMRCDVRDCDESGSFCRGDKCRQGGI